MSTNQFLILFILAVFGWVTWWMFFRKSHSKMNVGIHEFIHLLDKSEGVQITVSKLN
jgi:hypothetical protein